MKRRQYIVVAGCAASGVAGCLGDRSPAISGGIASADFRVREDQSFPVDADARVKFQSEVKQVTVRGAMPAGNPCTVATLQSAMYRAEDSRLTLTIGTKPTGDILKRLIGCPDSLTIADFTATITMESTLPKTVSVTEISAPLESKQTTIVRRNP